jgi:hypothetical protein
MTPTGGGWVVRLDASLASPAAGCQIAAVEGACFAVAHGQVPGLMQVVVLVANDVLIPAVDEALDVARRAFRFAGLRVTRLDLVGVDTWNEYDLSGDQPARPSSVVEARSPGAIGTTSFARS